MEPTVRNPRIEPAIGSEVARRSHLSRRFPSADQTVPSRNSVAGNGIFGCGDWRPKIRPRDRYCRQRPRTLKTGGKIPAETASFQSTTISAVREDWVVVCVVRYEPVSGGNSLVTGNFTGNFAILGLRDTITCQETAALQPLLEQFPTQIISENILENSEF